MTSLRTTRRHVEGLDGRPPYDTSFVAPGGFGLFSRRDVHPASCCRSARSRPPLRRFPHRSPLLLSAFGVGVALLRLAASAMACVPSWPRSHRPLPVRDGLRQDQPSCSCCFALGWRSGSTRARSDSRARRPFGQRLELQPGLILVGTPHPDDGWPLRPPRADASWHCSAATATVPHSSAGVDRLRPARRPRRQPHRRSSRRRPAPSPTRLARLASCRRRCSGSSMALAIRRVVFAAFRLPPRPRTRSSDRRSLLSPILSDHYAILLLLQVASLLDAPLVRRSAHPSDIGSCSSASSRRGLSGSRFWAMLVAVVGVGFRRNSSTIMSSTAHGRPCSDRVSAATAATGRLFHKADDESAAPRSAHWLVVLAAIGASSSSSSPSLAGPCPRTSSRTRSAPSRLAARGFALQLPLAPDRLALRLLVSATARSVLTPFTVVRPRHVDFIAAWTVMLIEYLFLGRPAHPRRPRA